MSKGTRYRGCDNWFNSIDVNQFNNRPINYLEIGVFYGCNLLTVCDTYAS